MDLHPNIERICALNKLNRINTSISADFIKKIYNLKNTMPLF